MFHLVEFMADEGEKSFNQSCKHGCLVSGHAVYCHSEHPNAPRKCQRTWATNGRLKDEDCPYFEPNNNTKK